MTVTESVEGWLEALGDLAGHPFAASALALAADIDNPRTSATARSMSQRALVETVEKLAALKPEEEKPKGVLYELRGSTAKRGAGA